MRAGVVIAVFALLWAGFAYASTTDGTIDSVFKNAWSDRAGWVNFGNSAGNVHITNTALTGYAWSQNYGWINLGATKSGVKNDGQGNLSGSAWGEQLGWIDFSGVKINSSGVFTGNASIGIGGQINFDCTNCTVKTDWRAGAAAAAATASTGGGGGPEVKLPASPSEQAASLAYALERIRDFVAAFLPQGPVVPSEISVPKEAPPALKGVWALLPEGRIGAFVFAPLPRDVAVLAQKFPALGGTLKRVGVTRLSELRKLQNVTLHLPGLTEEVGVGPSVSGPAQFALPEGIPLADLASEAKARIPSEVVFARSGGERIDLGVGLTIAPNGTVEKSIRTVAGSALHLVVKPEHPAGSIKGYLVLKSRLRREETSMRPLPLREMLASLVFAQPVFAEPTRSVEERLALVKFEYTDPDGDGIYTADVQAPRAGGEYEVITLISYRDPEFGTKEIRLTTVVDPEGYVFERRGDKETRIPGATVSLFFLNPATKKYELWPARGYRQDNPQITGVTGVYAFLVPPGEYYISVTASGYRGYKGKPFNVSENNEVHMNIEMTSPYAFLRIFDFKVVLLIIVFLLLGYNFYKDKLREAHKGQ